MGFISVRVDQKLIHGQVTVAWVPNLDINTIIVVDAEVAADSMTQRVMRLGLPLEVEESFFVAPEELPQLIANPLLKSRRILVLFKDLAGVRVTANDENLEFKDITLGNQAYPPKIEVVRLSESFRITSVDLEILKELTQKGFNMFLQSVPGAPKEKWALNPAALDFKAATS